jgi:hypothetical protein
VTLPRLRFLKIRCKMDDDAALPLARCKILTHLILESTKLKIAFPLPVNLVRLYLWEPSREVVDGIAENCPDLRDLHVRLDEADKGDRDLIRLSFKNGLKKLAKLFVNGLVQLGTTWKDHY